MVLLLYLLMSRMISARSGEEGPGQQFRRCSGVAASTILALDAAAQFFPDRAHGAGGVGRVVQQ